MDRLKRSAEAFVVSFLLRAAGRVNAGGQRLLLRYFASKVTLVVTNVPGPRKPRTLAGQTRERLDESISRKVFAKFTSDSYMLCRGEDTIVLRTFLALKQLIKVPMLLIKSGLPRIRVVRRRLQRPLEVRSFWNILRNIRRIMRWIALPDHFVQRLKSILVLAV